MVYKYALCLGTGIFLDFFNTIVFCFFLFSFWESLYFAKRKTIENDFQKISKRKVPIPICVVKLKAQNSQKEDYLKL